MKTALRRGLPVVDMCLRSPDLPLPRVLQDNEGIGEAAAEHFISRGFRHFAYGGTTLGDWASVERLQGYRRALRQHGFDCAEVGARQAGVASNGQPGHIQSLGKQLRDLPLPFAILAHNDDFAVEILHACESVSLDVPSEVAIVGIDNDELVCDFARVPLSSVDSNLEQQAYEAARLLDRLMAGAPPPLQPIRIPHKGIVIRQSSDVLAVGHKGLAAAIGSIWRNCADPLLSVERIAGEVGITRQGLDRASVKHLGRTISKEIHRIRLQNALTLLCGSSKRIVVIASECGYSRTKHLRDTVLRETGMTPTAFRQHSTVATRNA